jgi:hypothetical protein
MRQVLHAYYLQALPVQAQARSERVNNNIGQKKKMQRLASWNQLFNEISHLEECLRLYDMCNIYILYYVYVHQ